MPSLGSAVLATAELVPGAEGKEVGRGEGAELVPVTEGKGVGRGEGGGGG